MIMVMDNNPLLETPQESESNPLELWVSYIPGEGDKKNYLSDGKGHLRIFKSEAALREWLEPQLPPEVYEMVVVHPVQGQIAVPEDASPRRRASLMTPLDLFKITPISTLARDGSPTAQDLLESYKKRRLRRK